MRQWSEPCAVQKSGKNVNSIHIPSERIKLGRFAVVTYVSQVLRGKLKVRSNLQNFGSEEMQSNDQI